MLKDDFVYFVKQSSTNDEYLNWALEKYIERHEEDIKKLKKNDPEITTFVKSIINAAKTLRRFEKEKKAKDDFHLKGENDSIRANELLKEVQPYIQDIRVKIFNSPETPFLSRTSAIAWIVDQSETIIEEDRIKNQKLMEYYQNYLDLQRKGEISDGLIMDRNRKILDYIGSDGWVARAISCTKKLLIIKDACVNISKYTGFKEAQITMYILNGEIPDYPRYDFKVKFQFQSLPTGQSINRKYGELTINVSDISKREITKVYDYFRESLNMKYKNKLSEKGKRIIEYIESLSTAPPENNRTRNSGVIAYWEAALTGWNSIVDEKDMYSKWHSFMRAYNNALVKIK